MTGTLFDLSGRVALVTGGNRGLGLAMAEGLLRHGAAVMIVGRDHATLERARESLGRCGAVDAVVADITTPEGIATCVGTTVARWGGIDVLVNNAGVNIRHRPEAFPAEDWDRVIDTNLSSTFFMSKAVHPYLKQRQRGKIINIGSMTSLLGAPLSPAYGATKGAVVALTRSLATAWAPDRIQVNVILPGWIETDLTRKHMADMPELKDRILSRTPTGRWGVPSDLAGAAVFLSSAASDFATGSAITVDGGFSIFN
jgi:2-deoxy-D-gluconate 3-dehydrogenase